MLKDYLQPESKQINIWPGFVDIMTFTLFTILLIFIVAFVRYQYLDYLVGKGEEDLQELLDIFSEEDYKMQDGKIIIDASVLFDFDKDSLTILGIKKLSNIGSKLSEFLDKYDRKEKFSIIIEGHTDTQGPHEYNLDLSFRRAKAVTDLWQDSLKLGTKNDKIIDIIPAGYGETRLIKDTPDEKSEKANRRIEIRIVPKFNKMLEGWFNRKE